MHNLPTNLCARVPSGPKPIFTERLYVKIRSDQRDALERIAVTLGLSLSDVVRWLLDEGTQAVESVPSYHTLKEM
jgi:hypothetical protein